MSRLFDNLLFDLEKEESLKRNQVKVESEVIETIESGQPELSFNGGDYRFKTYKVRITKGSEVVEFVHHWCSSDFEYCEIDGVFTETSVARLVIGGQIVYSLHVNKNKYESGQLNWEQWKKLLKN